MINAMSNAFDEIKMNTSRREFLVLLLRLTDDQRKKI